EGELDERDGERPPGKAARRDQIGRRRPEQDDERLCDQARLDADDERVLDDGIRQLVDQMSRRRVDEERDDPEDEESESYERRDAHHDGEQDTFHSLCFGLTRGRKPATFIFLCPPFERTRLMNARASVLFPLAETMQMPY